MSDIRRKYDGLLSWGSMDCGPEDDADQFFGVGVGWWPLIDKLFNDLFDAGWDGKLVDVKEKYGTLNVYLYDYTDELERICDVAERRSAMICETCGAPGKRRPSGWIKTLCEKHYNEFKSNNG